VTEVQSLEVEDVLQWRGICCVPSDEGLVCWSGERKIERGRRGRRRAE